MMHLERAALLACAGVAAEVLFTAVTASNRDKRLKGYSYVWMFPIYALMYPGFSAILPLVGGWGWPLRGALYAALIMTVELLTGLTLRAALGEAPWEAEYRGHKRTVLGLVRLDYFPAWALAALLFERVYRLLAA